MPQIIAIIGATGTQGGSVARAFSSIPRWEVQAITRNPDAPAAKQLVEKLGATIVKADLGDVESLKLAFKGANAIFAVTDFWQFVGKPSTQEIAAAKGITWNEACYLQEVEHGKNIIDAASQVVEQGKLERMVLSSLSDAKRASKGKYTWVYHFDGKAHVVQYLEERARESPQYRSLFEKTSYLQMGYYLDNWKSNPIFAPTKNSDGTFIFLDISNNPSEEGATHPMPFVHPPSDTGPFVEGLVLKAPPRTTMLGTSSLMQYSEYVKLWGDINGVKTEIKVVSIGDVEKMWPDGFGLEVAQTVCYVGEFGWNGGESVVLPEEAGVDKSALSDVTSYIKTTDWSSVLN